MAANLHNMDAWRRKPLERIRNWLGANALIVATTAALLSCVWVLAAWVGLS